MKTLTRIILLLATTMSALSVTTSCTRNNGDIGDWFGRWEIMEIDADGTPVPGYEPRFAFAFQNDIVCISYYGEYAEKIDRWATWSQPADNMLLIDTNHSDDSGDDRYRVFDALHMTPAGATSFNIVHSSGKDVTLSQTASDGITYTYILRKRG